MAWTSPRTWVTGELVTASLLNTHVRDNLSYLKSAPTFDSNVTVSGTLTVSTVGGNVSLLNQANTFTNGLQTINGSNSYVRMLSASTSNDAASRYEDGTNTWYVGMLGSTVSNSGDYRIYNGGTKLSLTSGGVLSLGTNNVTHLIGAAGTGAVITKSLNTSGTLYVGVDSSTGSSFSLGNYAAIVVSDVAAGLSFGSTHASGQVRFYANGVFAASLAVSGGGPVLALQSGAYGTGTVPGAIASVGRNTSGGGAPGVVAFTDKTGAVNYVWADSSNVLRINSGSVPTETGGDTIGTIVGTQTSQRSTKNIFGAFTDYAGALRTILDTPVFDFDYKSGAYSGQRFVGITTDNSPTFGMDEGRSFNPVTAFGFTVAAFKALEARVRALEGAA